MDMTHTHAFVVVNAITAVVSLTTALYLVPLVPNLMHTLDDSLKDLDTLDKTTEAKRKVLTFMAFLCHEIRNPLFAITSNTTFLGDEPLTRTQESALYSIHQSADLMLRIVNDVLDISKLESGKLELEERDFDLRQLLQGIATSMGTHIRQTHDEPVDFIFDLAEKVPLVVSGDSVRLMQIAYNLLSNASKFTEKGHIEFSVQVIPYETALKNKLIEVEQEELKDDDFNVDLLKSTEEDKGSTRSSSPDYIILKIAVSDTGCGISQDRIHRIFEPFSQSKLSDYRKHGGTGLGLSIVACLTKIMGGTIHVDSIEGTGSTFCVYVPVLVSQNLACILEEDRSEILTKRTVNPKLPELLPVRPKNHSENKSVKSRVKSRVGLPSVEADPPTKTTARKQAPKLQLTPNSAVVLVVDDNVVNLKLLGRMLTHFNVEYQQARQGQEAVDKIMESRNVTGDEYAPFYRLILMDMSMPVMGGAEAIAILRAKNVNVPIVALTANALTEHKDEALKAGATQFATKPIMRDDLYILCQKFLLSTEVVLSPRRLPERNSESVDLLQFEAQSDEDEEMGPSIV